VRRRLFSASRGLSLLFVVTVASLWIRSYFVRDSFLLAGSRNMIPVWSEAGSLTADVISSSKDRRLPWPAHWFRKSARPNTNDAIALLSDCSLDPNYAGQFGWRLRIPHWALIVPGLVLPTTAAVRRLARRRKGATGFPVEPPATSSPP
jgi:hypothetical protein